MKLVKEALVLAAVCSLSISEVVVAAPLAGDSLSKPAEAGAVPAASALEALLQSAENLMRSGKPEEAYALLRPKEFEYAGDKRFDYLLGISALDSGKADKATFAFERVLAVDPNFAGARLDMARAYFQLGDMARAKTEFETVKKQNPPEAARITIEKYLEAIRIREETKKTQLAYFLEETVGYDTNINSATSQADIPVPAFGNLVFTLNQSSLKTSSGYAGLAGGADIAHQFNEKFGAYAGMDFRARSYPGHGTYSNLDFAARAGVTYSHGAEVFRVGYLGDQYRLGSIGTRNRKTNGVSLEWRHTVSPSDQLTTFTQYSLNRFIDIPLRTQNFDLFLLGESWLHVIGEGQSVAFGSVFGGRENDVAKATTLNPSGGRPDGNKNMFGLRAGMQTTFNEKWDGFASVGVQKGSYDKENQAFLTTRSDTMLDGGVGANWHPNKRWTVRPQLTLSRNNSNIPVYSFTRADFAVVLRQDFN